MKFLIISVILIGYLISGSVAEKNCELCDEEYLIELYINRRYTFVYLGRCGLPYAQGSADCTDYVIVWSYNSWNNVCVKYRYSGCGGNENIFSSLQECLDECASD